MEKKPNKASASGPSSISVPFFAEAEWLRGLVRDERREGNDRLVCELVSQCGWRRNCLPSVWCRSCPSRCLCVCIFIYYMCVYVNNDAPSHPGPSTKEAAGEEGSTAAPSFQQPPFKDHRVPTGCGVSAEGPGMTWALLEMEPFKKGGMEVFSVLVFQLRGEHLSPLL